jgi:hypothetical protein
MSGVKNGVAVKFLDIVKSAVYVHCHAHKLNLALCDASSQVKDIADVLIYIQNTSVFIQRSGKRFAMFEHIKDGAKKEKLELFCATRWESRYCSIQAFIESYEYLITFLEIVGDDNDKAIGAQARGYLKEIKSFKFVFYSKKNNTKNNAIFATF